MDRKSREIVLSAFIAALYAILVIGLPSISFQIIQVRVADALIPLSIIYGNPVIIGVTIGCFLANILVAPWGNTYMNALDAVLGSVANFIASWVAYWFSKYSKGLKGIFLSLLLANLTITFIVGSYIPVLVFWAFGGEFIPIWLGWLGVFLGEFVSINILGLGIVTYFKKIKLREQ